MTRVIRLTESECRAELDAIYALHPELRAHRRECCGGCAENDLGNTFGWGHPVIAAWQRVEALRYLLGDDA